MSKYLRIGNITLNKHKITQANFRNSLIYWQYPYKLDIAYSKPWTESYMFRVGRVSIPITDHYEYKYLSIEIEKKSEVEMYKKMLIESNVPVTDSTS